MERHELGWELLLPATLFDGNELVPWSEDPTGTFWKQYPAEMVQIGQVGKVYVVGWDADADFRDAASRVKVRVARERNYSYISLENIKEGLLEDYFAHVGGTRESLRVSIGERRSRYADIEVSVQAPCIRCSMIIRRSLADSFVCSNCVPGQITSSAGHAHFLFSFFTTRVQINLVLLATKSRKSVYSPKKTLNLF